MEEMAMAEEMTLVLALGIHGGQGLAHPLKAVKADLEGKLKLHL
jgi:hypothetical protein